MRENGTHGSCRACHLHLHTSIIPWDQSELHELFLPSLFTNTPHTTHRVHHMKSRILWQSCELKISKRESHYNVPWLKVEQEILGVLPPIMSFFRITLIRSSIGLPKRTQGVLKALGLRKRMATVYHPVSPQVAGQIMMVKELVAISEVDTALTKAEMRDARRSDPGYYIERPNANIEEENP